MIRYYYDQTTGEILSFVSVQFANTETTDPYIDSSQKVKIDSYIVNILTKELEVKEK